MKSSSRSHRDASLISKIENRAPKSSPNVISAGQRGCQMRLQVQNKEEMASSMGPRPTPFPVGVVLGMGLTHSLFHQ